MKGEERHQWLESSGEMADRIRSFDWAATALGALSAWPQSLRTAVELMLSSGFPCAIHYGTDCVLLYNDRFAELIGARHPTALGCSSIDVFPESSDYFLANIEKARLGLVPNLENQSFPLMRDGHIQEAYFSLTHSPLRSEDGSIQGIFVTGIETTSTLQAEAVLREREARHAFLLRLSDALIQLTEPRLIMREACHLVGEYLRVDRAFYSDMSEDKGLGLVRPEYHRAGLLSLEGRYLLADFIEKDTRLSSGRPFFISDIGASPLLSEKTRASYLALGIVAYACVPLVRDGRLVWTFNVTSATPRDWLLEEVTLLQEVAGRTWHALEQAKSEEILRQSEERLRILIESVQDYAIFTVDTRGRVTSWNTGAERIFGYSDAEIIGEPVALLFTEEDRALGVPAQEMESARQKGYGEDERWHVRKDGSRFYASGVMRPLADIERGFVKVARDLTRQKEAEYLLQEAHQDLQRAHDQLEVHVQNRTRDLLREVRQREEMEQARERLLQRVVTAQEEERRRLAREMHDQLGQQLTALLMGLKTLSLDPNLQTSSETSQAHLENLQNIAVAVMERMHHLAWELRPAALDDIGLESALGHYVREWGERSDTRTDFVSRGMASLPRLPADIETALYRIVQEALTNVERHAGARNISVLLERLDGTVAAIIEDDGCGFEVEVNDAGVPLPIAQRLGLLGMAERAELVGGSLTIESTPGGGTTVYVRVPVLAPATGETQAG